MSGCHNCKHSAAIADGVYADLEWDQTPCSTCDVMRGADRVFEAYDRPGNSPIPCGDDWEGAALGTSPPGHLPVSVMQDLVLGLLKLRPELRDVVAWRFAGVPYDDIALMQGVTVQAVEKRHRRAMELWPALEELFPRKVARRSMGRVARSGGRRKHIHVGTNGG